jgi:beta-glucuronidase
VTRRFREHFLRRVHVLDGVWDFAFLGEADIEGVDPRSIVYHDVMAVPGCFDATPRYAGRRGLVAYRTRVPVARAGTLRWAVGAAHHRSKLFAQGQVLCGHGGGFTRFSADFTLDAPGEVELVALVDNRFDAKRSPLHHEKFDWYQYGGLTRSSELHELPSLYIDRVEARTLDLQGPRLDVSVVFGGQGKGGSVPFRITFDGELVVDSRVELTASGGVLQQQLTLPGAELWSPERPSLHLLGVQLGEDDQFERIGLRTVEAKNRAILVNGRPVHILGVNRQENHPTFGHAVPEQVQVADLQLIRRLGLNFVRGSQQPQDQTFLDLCDELGILVDCEALGFRHGIEDLRNQQFLEAQLQHVEEMISGAINHPSVILWGVLAESASSEPDAHAPFSKLIGYIRARDPSRLVTFASNRHGSDRCLDLVDVVSVNAHPGWSFGTLESLAADLDAILAEYRAVAPNKPVLLSEIGAAAIYGVHDYHAPRWSEEYQARFLERFLDVLRTTQHELCGACLWQLCDTRSTDRADAALDRPRGFDNKGLFDEYRRPKLGALTVERALSGDAPPTKR